MANLTWDNELLADLRKALSLDGSQAWIVINENGRVAAGNQRAATLLGMESESLVGVKASRIFKEEERVHKLLSKPRIKSQALTSRFSTFESSWMSQTFQGFRVLVSGSFSASTLSEVGHRAPLILAGISDLAGLDEYLPEWTRSNDIPGQGFLAAGSGGLDMSILTYWPRNQACPAPLRFSGQILPTVRLGRAYPSLPSDLMASDPWNTGFGYLPLIYGGRFVGVLATSGAIEAWFEPRDVLAEFVAKHLPL